MKTATTATATPTAARQIQVGDIVRSFDFPDHNRDLTSPLACFVDGEVVDIGRFDFGYVGSGSRSCDRYQIRVIRRVFGGADEPFADEFVYPPVNGTRRYLGGVTDGVELIM